MKRPSDINIVMGLSILGNLTTAAYWVLWFLVPGSVQSLSPADPRFAAYSAFELAFPLPDAYVVVVSLVGVIGLWKMKDWGFLAMWLAAGGSLFLAFEDLLFDLENGMFVPFSGAAATELGVIFLTLALALAGIVLLWKHRKELLH